MGLLRPSAVEHTTGVVFRVGIPGRLAGRCLWPSLSSRKSKATGVVAVPFSSISPLQHLLRFLPSFYSFPFSFSFFFRSLRLYLYPVLLLFLSLVVATFSRRACRACVSKFCFLGVRVEYRGVVRPQSVARVHVSKQEKLSESVAAIRFAHASSSRIWQLPSVVYVFRRPPSRVEESSDDLDRSA